MELKIIGGVVGLFLVYLIILYFVNKEKAKKLAKTIAVQIEILAKSSFISSKKDFFYKSFAEQIDRHLVKLPMASYLLKLFVKYSLDKYLETKVVPEMNETIAPYVRASLFEATERGVEKLTNAITSTEQPSTNETVVDLAKTVLENESKGVVSIFGKVMKEGDKPKADFEVGVGIAKKF